MMQPTADPTTPPDGVPAHAPADAVQRAIVDDMLRSALPLVTALYSAIVVVTVLTPSIRAEPLRIAPHALGALLLGLTWALRRRSPARAVDAMCMAIGLSVVFAMAVNGGVLAVATLGLFAVILMIVWVHGRGVSAWFTAGASVYCLALAVLQRLGHLNAPPPIPPVVRAIAIALILWCAWLFSVKPQERLRRALREATARTNELRAERRRREASELVFKAVFDQVAHLLVLVGPDGRAVDANRAALAFLGERDVAALARAPLADAPGWAAETQTHLRAAIAAALSEGANRRLDVSLPATSTVLDVTVAPCRDADGALRFAIVEGRDVSALLALKARESQLQRVDLVGQLAGGVAHDFNNVLSTILAASDLVRTDLDAEGTLTPGVDESLAAMAAAAQRAASVTRRLLSLGRRAPVERRPLAAHTVVQSMQHLIARALPPTVRVVTCLEAPRDTVLADAADFESMLLNLCVNARDAMPQGGTLTLSSDVVQLDEAWCARSTSPLEPGAYLRLSVQDTGTGIAPHLLERIFEPYFTTKSTGRGTGIGLASVFAAMRDHEGAVHVHSEVGRGTVFHLDFPLVASAAAPTNAAVATRDLAGLRCLAVDDEAPLLRMVARILGDLGVACVTAPDAEAGLAAYLDDGQGFDFAVLDVMLPGRRGSELAAELLARDPRLRVLLVSGFPKGADLDALPRDRARLLHKPFSAADLRASLEALLPHDRIVGS